LKILTDIMNKYNQKLGDFVIINPESMGKDYPYTEIEYVEISSIGSGTLEGTNITSVENAPSRAKRIVKHGDTILSTVRPNRRSFLFIKQPPKNMIVSTGFAVLRPSKELDPRYLYCLIRQQKFTDYLANNAKGAAYPAVDSDTIKRAELFIPPLLTQQKIASILSAYDDLIENNTRRIHILEDMAQAIYREWFVHFRFPGHEDVKLVGSELGMTPEGWNIVEAGNRFIVLLGGTPSTKVDKYWQNGTVAWINSSKVNEFRVIDETEFITEEALSNSSAKLLPKRSTLIAITGATLGQVSLLEIEAAANQSIVGVYDNEGYFGEYLYLKFCEIIEKLIGKASGSAQQHINKGVVADTQLLIPNKPVISKFRIIIRPYFDLVVNLMYKNKNLRLTRDLLLPRLISGELDVRNLNVG